MAKRIDYRLKCPKCKKYYEFEDLVLLDIVNTVFHKNCYTFGNNRIIKDRGTYREILEKYDFMRDLLLAMEEIK